MSRSWADKRRLSYMIERQTINSRKASVAYFDDNFIPRDKDVATFAKVIFEDTLESIILRLKDQGL